jgi:uncharacterized membrane protein
LFRLQAWLLSPGATLAGILKVDILNVMGPSIALAATLWARTTTIWVRVLLLASVSAACSLLTPLVRTSTELAMLPDWHEWYLRPPQGRSWFALFPWGGLLLAGSVVGEALHRATNDESERRVVRQLGLAGIALFVLSFLGSFLPSLYENTYFWTTSPAYFFVRLGLMTALIPMAWWWCRRMPDGFSPMRQLGRTSLFIYWIHVEMVYGILSWPIHRARPIDVAFAVFLAFGAAMLYVSILKDRGVAAWKARQAARNRLAAARS